MSTISQITQGCESGGEFVQITLSSGKIIFVWAESVVDESKAVVQVYDSLANVEAGLPPAQHYEV
jgi:hypothetical protein